MIDPDASVTLRTRIDGDEVSLIFLPAEDREDRHEQRNHQHKARLLRDEQSLQKRVGGSGAALGEVDCTRQLQMMTKFTGSNGDNIGVRNAGWQE